MTAGPPERASSLRRNAVGLAGRAVLLGSLGVLWSWVVLGTPVLESGVPGVVLLLGVLALGLLGYAWGLHRERRFLLGWVVVSAAFSVISVVTGYFNALTDEPVGMPAFLHLLPNLYGSSVHLVYYQYGNGPHVLSSAYIYLPLLVFLQAPGVGYRWVTVGAWLATVYLFRRRGVAVLLLANPMVGLLAASGFNDFVALFALTLALVSLSGRPARVAEVVALGLKQFANVVFVLYFAWHRRWCDALIAVAVTAAFLLPFAVLSPTGVLCHAVLLDPYPTCSSGASASFAVGILSHINYYVWPVWLLAAFGGRYVAELTGPAYAGERAALARWRGRAPQEAAGPGWTVLLLPLVRLGSRLRRRPPRPRSS